MKFLLFIESFLFDGYGVGLEIQCCQYKSIFLPYSKKKIYSVINSLKMEQLWSYILLLKLSSG